MKDKLKEGVKYDGGKLRFDLIPGEALIELAKIYTFGAAKYEDNNWRKGMKWSRIFGAIMRHTWAWYMGEDIDPESGLPHMSHAAWGCFTLMSYAKHKREFDDRIKVDFNMCLDENDEVIKERAKDDAIVNSYRSNERLEEGYTKDIKVTNRETGETILYPNAVKEILEGEEVTKEYVDKNTQSNSVSGHLYKDADILIKRLWSKLSF